MKDFKKIAISMLSVSVFILFSTGILLQATQGRTTGQDFTFIQMSDTHWGFTNTKINPDYSNTLKKVVKNINDMPSQPDFIVFTGDLTHTTDDPKIRQKRLSEFKQIVAGLKVKSLYFLPGEHDAALDKGKAFMEILGKTHYVFQHKGVTFIVLDNVSDPTSSLGDEQLGWLKSELKKIELDSRIVVFTHRPLFNLKQEWDWWTRDGAKAMDLLSAYKNVTVFYGHIHQLDEHTEGNIKFYAAKGLMYPLPAPGSVPKKAPLPWDPAEPYKGLGYRLVKVNAASADYSITEFPVNGEMKTGNVDTGETNRVIKIIARKFEYTPDVITLKKGVPVILEFTSTDVMHGFNCPAFHVRTNISPGSMTRVRIVPDKSGTNSFHCDVFCGEGHENMTGKIIVKE